MHHFLDILLHVDRYLPKFSAEYGSRIYLILFLIVFCETGLVVTPFLPGDSLLFAAGAIAGTTGNLSVGILILIFFCAALCGDNVNYWMGKLLGPRILKSERSRLLNRKHVDRTHDFFERHGGKTIILARFVPIVRTFTPFVAGIGAMKYLRFLAFSIAGAILWVSICVLAGYFFGQIEAVKRNFTLVALAIVLVSVLPALIEILRHRSKVNAKSGSA